MDCMKYYLNISPNNQVVIYYDDFETMHGELYFKGREEPLMRKRHLKPYKSLIRILGKNRIYNLGFNVSEWPLSKKQDVALNKAQKSYLLHLT